MNCLVTGCAGFIGFHLCKRLLDERNWVTGIDRLSNYYSIESKKQNLAELEKYNNFSFHKIDLGDNSLLNQTLLKNLIETPPHYNIIYHLAAQAGVRASWGKEFKHYVNDNILATQNLLETCKDKKIRFIFVSSSSVYGEKHPISLPMHETSSTDSISPYGITKETCEKLCNLYRIFYKMDITILRFFTVYGPRQRPDMAINKFIKKINNDSPIYVYGDGKQLRDFTYVDDIVDGIIAAGEKGKKIVYNLGSGNVININDLIKQIEIIMKKLATVNYVDKQKGDVSNTHADIIWAEEDLNYKPKFTLEKGLRKQIEWQLKGDKQ